MAGDLSLIVNDIPIKTDHFVAGFVEHTVCGMIEALKDAGKINNLTLIVDGDRVMIDLNGAPLQTKVFAGKIIKSTIVGMLVNLKGVTDIKKVSIIIDK